MLPTFVTHKHVSVSETRFCSSSDPVENVDWISKLPSDVLIMILSRLSTEEAVRTSLVSKRWEHVWKHMPHLVLDMRKKFTNSKNTLDVSNRVATLITKIIKNHRGHLESCVINHYTNDMLTTWIQSLTALKQTKHLTLRHHLEPSTNSAGFIVDFPPNSFSYPGLTSLSLYTYILRTSHSFNKCQFLKTLKLSCILAPDVGVFNRVLASCPSLVVLVLHIYCQNKTGPLKIENNRLKLLKVSYCFGIDGIKVSSPSLHFLAMDEIFSLRRDSFVLTSPRLQFNRNFWLTRTYLPHISYNISQEENCIGHEEFVVNTCVELLRVSFSTSLSVSVDLMNPREVERLRQVLLLWTFEMADLEILFKNNNTPSEKRESSHNKLWEENQKDPFPNADFRVSTVWMHNFSGSVEEFALASCLIKQGTVVKNMMIRTPSFPARKKLEIETAVARLQTFRTQDQWKLTIKCF